MMTDSIIKAIKAQIITDLETTSINVARFGTETSETHLPCAFCDFSSTTESPADACAVVDSIISLGIVIHGVDEEQVQLALEDVNTLWRSDASREPLRLLNVLNIRPIRRYLPASEQGTKAKYLGYIEFEMIVRDTY